MPLGSKGQGTCLRSRLMGVRVPLGVPCLCSTMEVRLASNQLTRVRFLSQAPLKIDPGKLTRRGLGIGDPSRSLTGGLLWVCESEPHPLRQGRVAQWPERQAVNLRVVGSTPTLTSNARMAKLVDAVASRPTALMRESSSPPSGTKDEWTERSSEGLQLSLRRVQLRP